ncbi:MAG TPA: EAL domain-containing protein [Thermoanaerobaculia bacterium]|nr:EAL domain-containing protein [Thermoanaerobaculia bacterium]
MPELTIAAGLSFSAHFITAVVMTALLAGCYRQYRKSYVYHWTLSWAALAVAELALVGSRTAAIYLDVPPFHPFRIGPAMVANAAAYLQIAWLAFGAYELVRRRPVRLRESKRILLTVGGFGALMAVLFTHDAGTAASRHMARLGVFAALSAVALAVMAVAIWRTRRLRAGVGSAVLGVALGLHAMERLAESAVAFSALPSGLRPEMPIYWPMLSLLLLSLIGLGMIASLLEDEREAASIAADQVEHLAYHDALTGLPNRPLFMDRLIIAVAQANRASQKLAVLFLDLDRFKDINDSLGHSVGDVLLKSAAERIRRCVREGDTVARFGGDEFTLVIPRIDKIEDAAKIASKIIETVKVPFEINERELFVTTSIGVAIYPSDGLDAETLVRNADTAMYRAKEQGRDSYQLYAPAMNARALERLALENTLRRALSQNELVLHYQPVVVAGSGVVVGVESLVRWQHPERGLLGPVHFISLAEMSGLIVPIGEWVLRTACRQVRHWQKELDQPLTIAVNLSARQFQHPDLVAQIRSVIADTGIEPSSLELEITESSAMQNAENTIVTLRELKDLGVNISMDDFGTGYSSLNYLKQFPIDTLKLDQSFVRDVTTDRRDAAIVGAVISMAHRLGIAVIAEGVETQEQLDYLRREECDYVQGYLFSRPIPPPELERFLRARSAGAMQQS